LANVSWKTFSQNHTSQSVITQSREITAYTLADQLRKIPLQIMASIVKANPIGKYL
jgi:hypothetical protein